MAKASGRPDDESLSRAVEQLKRDGLAWATAEQDLLRARVKSTVKRVELAAFMTIAALMVTIAGTIVLANTVVQGLAASLGPIRAGVVVGVVLLLVGALLIVWVKSLLRQGDPGGRAQSTVKVIWNALNEPN
jgi:hypothetical protein